MKCPNCKTVIIVSAKTAAGVLGSKKSEAKKISSRENGKRGAEFGKMGGRPKKKLNI